MSANQGETEQRYFHVSFSDFMRASEALWASDDQAGRPRTKVSSSAAGSDTSMWTSLDAQARLRQVLVGLNIQFEEGSEQQVRTWLDGLF